MTELIDIDGKYNTEFDFRFNTSHFRDFVKYVDEQTSDDFLNYLIVKKQFDGFLNSSNNTLIATDLLLSFTNTETISKLTKIVNFTSEYFAANYNNYHDNDREEVKQRIICMTLKLKDYMLYCTTHYNDILKYIRYQNYIHQGNDYIKFDEFEK